MNNDEVKYIIFDIESVPDTKLIKKVKYPGMEIDDTEAVNRFQEEILANSDGTSLFIPVTFQYPVSICIATAAADFTLLGIELLDDPDFRPAEMVRKFWDMAENIYKDASLVSFNGRGFDIPLLELMAFRYGFKAKRHFKDKFGSRYRFGTQHIDIHDWLSNYSAVRLNGGLDLLAKVLGKPGKMTAKGDDVYDMYKQGKIKEINDYCMHDVLDTYFVFLRTRVMIGEISLEREQAITKYAVNFLLNNQQKIPAFSKYLENLSDEVPWP